MPARSFPKPLYHSQVDAYLTPELRQQWHKWRQHLCLSGERRLFILSGEQHWAISQAHALSASITESLWLGTAPTNINALAISKFKMVLGQEYPVLIFNAFSGLHPDALGAVAGTISAGGILILLCPPLASWPEYQDPDLVRYVAQAEQAQTIKSSFLTRFIRLLAQDRHRLLWAQGQPFPHLASPSSTLLWQPYPDRSSCLNNEQRDSLAGLLIAARQRSPLILTADRGRGKSTLLGLAATRLIKRGYRVLLTAPSPNAICQVQAHCSFPLTFYAPDTLVESSLAADILLVDEAAAIPVSLLLKLAAKYCCFFSSTLHGYEGTGLGFQLKFLPQLLALFPNTHHYQLHIPARWSSHDPLEPLVFKLLALNARALPPPAAGTPYIRWLTNAELLDDEPLLQQVFGLLTLAHYQTRPSDLRHLLDAPELSLAAMFCQQTLIGVALLNTEGQSQAFALDPRLSQEIWRGQRRPRGHLLPQSLAFHGGFQHACYFRYHRIMRIVVHPHCQQQGLGSQLLHWLQQQANTPNTPLSGDFLGASFGASPELLTFWQKNYFRPLRLGHTQDNVSGLPAVMMLWPVTEAAIDILADWQAQFSNDLAHYLPTIERLIYRHLQVVAPRVNAELDRQRAYDFAFYHRDLMADQGALARFTAHHKSVSPLSISQQQFLAEMLRPSAQPSKIAKNHRLDGYKSAIAQLRKLMQGFFNATCKR
ncbi:tRNA(Met) cytidine acetyltransferase TmcA [Oceanisphaera avium]|uniref:tRNA(Met) cytidine acetyltransferase TmcA n=1 Tax=Oceanisphaera avium TaxID=1903694 RepID=A0A1Y0CX59_9GAMM|nr:GNAT family N-acetyltransferase [Oceanisphaera avium]ART79921.1 hypothetical protein CBP12_06965 [Oceanisphaera avium]